MAQWNNMQSGRTDSRIQRPQTLHIQTAFCDENVNITFQSSSEDEIGPAMNCKKVIDKPTLVSSQRPFVAIYFMFNHNFPASLDEKSG